MTTPNGRDFDVAPDVRVGDEITILSVVYVVDEVSTPTDLRAKGLDRLADRMIRNSCHAELICRRRRGQKLHMLRAFRTPQGPLLFRHILSLR
tara:strand:- start:2726 stop:3004 length:279 start_codon:yes stop_codon:yes gene_type:complete